MDRLQRLQRETKLIINFYTHDYTPTNIQQIIHSNLTHYKWTCKTLFDSNRKEFHDVLISCIDEIYQESDHNLANKQKILDFLRSQRINGRIFCALGRKDWMALLKSDNICSMGFAIKLWEKIYRFDFSEIKIGSPIYFLLNETRE